MFLYFRKIGEPELTAQRSFSCPADKDRPMV
jgi:hypothetical protein